MNIHIEEYIKTKNLSEDDKIEYSKICNSIFKMLKDKIDSGDLKNIRLKYFGVFEVNKPMVKYAKKKLIENYNKGYITESYFNKRFNTLNKLKLD